MKFFANLGFIYYATGMNEAVKKVSNKVTESVRDNWVDAERRCAEWSDERLMREARKESSVTRKMVYVKELQNRGYSAEDFKCGND